MVKAKDGTMLIDSPKYGQKLEQSGFKIVNSDDSDKETVNSDKIKKSLYKTYAIKRYISLDLKPSESVQLSY